MKYVKFQDKELSRLGYGIMRLPTEGDAFGGPVDIEESMNLIKHAYDNGINYFDTAYFYHGGKSENIIGKALARFPRESYYLADKFPGNFIKIADNKLSMDFGPMMPSEAYGHASEIFEKQLEKCGVDYFDFYLLHGLSENTFDLYSDRKWGIVDHMLEEKKKGRIKHFGFSTHASYEGLVKIINHWDCFEFCLIQHNYLDARLQDSLKKYELLTEKGIKVFVMEPVRGGKLANPGEKPVEILKAARPDATPANWAFRYLIDQPNNMVILSGMTKMEQLEENIETFSKDDPLTEADKAALDKVVESMGDFIPCTACRYCTETCPMQLDIPTLIETYNEAAVEFTWLVGGALAGMPNDKKPAACTRCGACNSHCPQKVDIPEVMGKFQALIEKNQPPMPPKND
ncbi:MAG: aldo/keto reductase [Oscillospiraceae bacterium]|nr:aldo/keto reductase [Oscillospiraceae bacterium]